ncbi:PREDICTED: neurotrypsin-like isoform X1 [Amphimedon queenslandica]|uniref:SRCR domain-containing protein n=1 Tax=Amphimedon queenslandica TaxID=400682 RepID=A0AAN0JG36_AMPQE|nr:PREDICTED: neurotrypsin-like isoform X1 [Amphimedon queenslandica]|eukprot:XP_019855766.1 PREDICTED: neurotrypsin-like isoform X1 [Amphimedon queenslandica]
MGLLSVLLLLIGLIYTAHCQNRGTVRLVRSGTFSSSYSAGIVQIYYFTSSSSTNRWGNICYDSSFGSTEASVICNQLGYNGASSYGRDGSTSSYGTDSSATIIDDVSCSNSNYLTLQQCTLSTSISTLSSCSLRTSYDAYVACHTTRIWNNPYSGQIRLQGSTYSSYGRLEVYCNGQWGTVCDDTFGFTDARVACRQLGYSDYNSYSGNLAGSSSQPIWLDRVYCSSSDSCLAYCESCPSSEYHDCTHSEDVALGCEFDTSRTDSTNTLSTCRYADSSANIGGIIGGVIAAFVICCVLIISIPICICCCLGVGIGAAARGGRSGRATVVTAGTTTATSATVTTTNTSNLTAPPPPAYEQQPPPPAAYPAAYPAAGYDAEKAPYPPQQGYPAQPGYPPQEGYPPQGYAYPPQGYEAQPGYPPQQGYNYPPPAYPAQ